MRGPAIFLAQLVGKGPGLDRSLDAIRHANLRGTSKHGGVLALTGDDHGMRSTDTPAHCEPTFEDLMIPLLYPANVQEVHARGGLVVLLSDAEGLAKAGDLASYTIELPGIDPFVAPILYTIPVQLLAYHTAVAKGTDVDQPRNLAKSVTVE